MSDSDCSNCDDFECAFRDYAYNCYVVQMGEIRNVMTREDFDLFHKALMRATELEDENENFSYMKRPLQEIIDLYNGE